MLFLLYFSMVTMKPENTRVELGHLPDFILLFLEKHVCRKD